MTSDRNVALFKKVSKRYDDVHGRTIAELHAFSQQNYYLRCRGATVLDIGNGGQSATEVLGAEVSSTLTRFVGIDNSIDMLKRRKCDFMRIVGDGMRLPFKDKSFDYVLVNGVFHHLGYLSVEDQVQRVSLFLSEARRVCNREIIVYELFVPGWIELVERLMALVTGYMPAFVLSYKTFTNISRNCGRSCKEVRVKTLSDLMGNVCWYPVMMAHEWLKVPAFMSPFKHSFFVIPS